MCISAFRENEYNDTPSGGNALLIRKAVITTVTGFTLPVIVLNEVIAMASKGVIAMKCRGKTLDTVFQRDEWVSTAIISCQVGNKGGVGINGARVIMIKRALFNSMRPFSFLGATPTKRRQAALKLVVKGSKVRGRSVTLPKKADAKGMRFTGKQARLAHIIKELEMRGATPRSTGQAA